MNYSNSNNCTSNYPLKSNFESVPSIKPPPPEDPYGAIGKAQMPAAPPKKKLSWYEQ